MSSYPPPVPPTPWPVFDSIQFISLTSSVTLAYLQANYLQLAGGTMTGPINAINITMSGSLVLGAGSILQSLNTTDSTSIITGSITTLGGIGVSKSVYIGSVLNVAGNTTLSGNVNATLTTASQPNITSLGTLTSLIMGGNINLSSNNINNVNTLTATTLSGTLSTASQPNITSLGNLTGLTMFGDISMSGHNISSVNTLTATTLTGTLSTANQSNITSLGTLTSLTMGGTLAMGSNNITSTGNVGGTLTTASQPNITSLGTLTSLTCSGQIKTTSTTDATSTSTGSITTSGGMGIQKSLFVGTLIGIGSTSTAFSLSINSTGNQIGITNSSGTNTTASIVLDSSANLFFEPNNNGTTCSVCITPSGYLSLDDKARGLGIPSYIIDLGSNSTPPAMALNLYAGKRGLGASSSALDYYSDASHTWYNVSSAQSGAINTSPSGTNTMTLTSGGALSTASTITSSGQVIATGGGLHTNSFSSTGLASLGASAHIHFASSTAQFFGYNYNTSTYTAMSLGNSVININTSGLVGVGGINTLGYPFEVYSSTGGITVSGGYGFLTSGGSTGSGSSTGSVAFSANFYARIAVHTEIDVYSDKRLKENIRPISEQEAVVFVEKVTPSYYNLKKNKVKSFGYIAQDIAKAELHEEGCKSLESLIQLHPAIDLQEEIDDEGFSSPENYYMTINYQKVSCLLHKYIQFQKIQIEQLQTRLHEMEIKFDIFVLNRRPLN
jgi:hypothetical protein